MIDYRFLSNVSFSAQTFWTKITLHQRNFQLHLFKQSRNQNFKFQCFEFKLNNSFAVQHVNCFSQSSFRGTFRSPYTRKWQANCDTLWTAATEIKSCQERRFVDVRGNIQVCRSFRKRASTWHATSTGTSLEKHLWREQRDVWPSGKAKWISLQS